MKRETSARRSRSYGILTGALALFVFAAAPAPDASARKVSDRVKVACSGDYDRFCGKYKVGSTKLRQCMRSNGKRLSRVCVEALVDAGEIPRRVLRKMR